MTSLLLMLAFAACADSMVAPNANGINLSVTPVSSGVTVTPSIASLVQGETVQLTESTNGKAQWSSSGAAIATVSSSGLVTGAAPGTATITARHGNRWGTAVITVTAPAGVHSVEVSPDTTLIVVGASTQKNAIVRDASGNPLSGHAVSWSSSNPSVATVNSSGVISAVAAGSVTVTATSEGISGAGEVSVTEEPAPPPSPGAVSGCPSSGYSRLVLVSTGSELASALSGARPGDQIRVAAGTYIGPTSLRQSGTSGAPIVVCGMPGSWPVLHGGRFTLSGSSYVVITGLVFEGPNNSNNNVYIKNVRDVQFTGNIVRNGDWHAGIAIEGSANVEITRNYIHDNGLTRIDHGIYFRAQAGSILVANNVIVNNRGRGISMHDNAGNAINNATVVHNTIVRNGNTGILVNVNAGTGNVVANNVLADNGWIEGFKQIRVTSGSGNMIANNISWSPDASRNGVEDTTSTNTVTGNVAQDPMFASSYGDLHLRAGSPAIGLALVQYSTSKDYDGKTRDSAPDAGAYEH